jgi:asparagine synthetase B (glutamine-hydrolysing)
MRSFAGVLQFDDSRPDPRLLRHLGGILRLDASSAPVLDGDEHCGIVTVLHDARRQEAEVADANALARLHTEFSFAVWDGERKELFCARDRFGVRPLYYARTAGALVFSDSLEAVLAHPDVRAEALDEQAVADYLAGGVTLDVERTIYAEVRRLPPAHFFRCGLDGRIALERYWTIPSRAPARRRDALETLEAALQAAIADRITGSSAVVFMSGGLDSPLLAALTSEVRPETRLLAGTSVYRTRIADVEEAYAVEAARSIGIEIRLFPLDEYPPLQALGANIWTPEPGPLLTAPMTRDLYRAAAEHAPVALHGHPADAVLSVDLTAYLRALPPMHRIAELVRYTAFRRRPPYFFFRRRRAPAQMPPPAWLLARREPVTAVEDPLASPIWSSYFEWAHPLATHAPIELVYPWCDARVVEAARALEPIPWLVDKHAARELLRGRVIERIRRRRKTYLAGDPWRAELPAGSGLDIEAAAAFIDPLRFRETCRADGFLADRTLRAVAFESWLRKLPGAIGRLRPVTV